MAPSPQEQIRFLVNLQRLLDEGSFVASYKFTLLLSLADLSVENGDDFGAALTVDTADIAKKFIQYYWPHVAPYRPQCTRKCFSRTRANRLQS